MVYRALDFQKNTSLDEFDLEVLGFIEHDLPEEMKDLRWILDQVKGNEILPDWAIVFLWDWIFEDRYVQRVKGFSKEYQTYRKAVLQKLQLVSDEHIFHNFGLENKTTYKFSNVIARFQRIADDITGRPEGDKKRDLEEYGKFKKKAFKKFLLAIAKHFKIDERLVLAFTNPKGLRGFEENELLVAYNELIKEIDIDDAMEFPAKIKKKNVNKAAEMIQQAFVTLVDREVNALTFDEAETV